MLKLNTLFSIVYHYQSRLDIMAVNRKRQALKQLPERKKEDELQELFVFGYQCKLFRDDEKAMFIDQGKHLIPWMGDPSMLIDRWVTNQLVNVIACETFHSFKPNNLFIENIKRLLEQ